MRLSGFRNTVTEESATPRRYRTSDLRCSVLFSSLDAEVTKKIDISTLDDEGAALFRNVGIRILSEEALYSSGTEFWV